MNSGCPLSHKRPVSVPRFLYGVAYYPEHWDENTRRGDPALFSAANFNVIRMGEFAWDYFEPEEGVLRFALFDETIARFAEVGISTILCTPTATPPRWLSRAHPEILRVGENDQVQQHGSRQHASHFCETFRSYSRAITRALAEHYQHNPNVIGWQTDNEFHCHFREDHCPAAVQAFQQYLEQKYAGSIDQLNQAWGTMFWSQRYSCFGEILTPLRNRPTHLNPAQVLDYQRFLSDGVARFQRDQVEILRAQNSRWWVTHNGCFGSIDYRGSFTRDLDFLSFDSYPFFDYSPTTRAASQIFNLDWVRAYSGNFVVMEQQSGPGGQGDYFHDNPEPGEMRRMAWTSIAHGADGLLFFRERSCRFGAEEYWCGVIDHDNIPRRRYHEAAELGQELEQMGPLLMNTSVRVDIGISGADFDSVHGHVPLNLGLPGPRKTAEMLHGYFLERQFAVGCVHPSDDLSGLQIYFITHLAQFDPGWVNSLTAWVEAGGTLIIGARTATKDLNNNVVSIPLPGILRTLAGVTIEEYGKQNRPQERPLELEMNDRHWRSSLWYEKLVPDAGTEVLARWNSRHLCGSPAITRRHHGAGKVIYIGTYFDDNLLDALCECLKKTGSLPVPFDAPQGVEVVERISRNGSILRFYINHNEQESTIPISGTELLTGKQISGRLSLEPNQVALFDCV